MHDLGGFGVARFRLLHWDVTGSEEYGSFWMIQWVLQLCDTVTVQRTGSPVVKFHQFWEISRLVSGNPRHRV